MEKSISSSQIRTDVLQTISLMVNLIKFTADFFFIYLSFIQKSNNKKIKMFKKTILSLLIIIPAILAAQVSVGDNQKWLEQAFISRFQLGNLFASQIVNFNFQYGSQVVTNIDISLYISTNALAITTLTCTSNPCIVTFPAASVATSGSYYVIAQYVNAAQNNAVTASSGTFVRHGKLTITGDNSARSSPFLVRLLTTIGKFRYHRIYLPLAGPIRATVKFSTITVSQSSWVTNAKFMKIIKQNSASTYSIQSPSIFIAGVPAALNTDTYQFTWANQQAGYYWLLVDVSLEATKTSTQISNSYNNDWQYIISYVTESYVCPYDNSYSDHKNIFAGCIQKSPVTDLPCIKFNEGTQQCTLCYTGYSLINGRCLVDQCPAGKYFDAGVCRDNPVGCAAYNKVTKCTGCVNTYRLKVDNVTQVGQCERIPLVCTGRTYYNVEKYVCEQVSADCKQFSSIDGKCTSCLQITRKLQNGVCVLAIDNCGPKQYIQNGVCFDINPLCQVYERVGGKCQSCIFGYKFDANKNCVMINCQQGYAPNDYGNCVKVSQLCITYDIRGKCLVCVPSHLSNQDGECLQIESPSPCPARKYLGFDSTCHQISQFCQIYNQQQKYCVKCKGNYYLMTASNQCVPPEQCTGKYYIVNNDCHQVDINCVNYNRDTGKCSSCKDGYDLYYGICIATYRCEARQWKDGNKKCQNVSNLCGDFNPSTGQCTSCINNYTLRNGICCPNGQFNVNGVCAAVSSASVVSNLDGCRLWAVGNGCVDCQQNYTQAEDSNGYGICKRN